MDTLQTLAGRKLTTSKPVSKTHLLQSVFETLLSRANKVGKGMAISWPNGGSPSNDERMVATAAIQGVRAAMEGEASEAVISDAIEMLTSGLKMSGQTSGKGVGKVYTLILAAFPNAIVEKGVQDLVTGKAEGMDKTFMPSAPELREYLDRVKRDWLAMATMTERMLSLPEQPAPPEPMTEDQLMRRREQIAALARPRAMPGDAA